MARRESGARQRVTAVRDLIGSWSQNHWLVMRHSLLRLLRTPASTLMTLLVIGIAMALPAWLYLLLASLRDLQPLEGETTISVYLEAMPTSEAEAVLRQARLLPRVAEARLLTADDALAEFERHSGLGDLLSTLDENPLSAVLLIEPLVAVADELEPLKAELQALQGVESVVLDLAWLQRLFALLQLLGRAVTLLAVVLGAAVVLVISNTIRLSVEARRDEIQIIKLVGATDAFVRRPFLYTGLWFGLGGGLMAMLLVVVSLWLLSAPLRAVTRLYPGLNLAIDISPMFFLLLLGAGALLGMLAAWLVTLRHLSRVQPS